MAWDEEVFFCSGEFESSNGDGVRLDNVNSDWFEHVQRNASKCLMCSAKGKVYCNEMESIVAWSSVCLVQIYSDNTVGGVRYFSVSDVSRASCAAEF